MVTAGDMYDLTRIRLREAGIEAWEFEAGTVLAHFAHITRGELPMLHDMLLPDACIDKIKDAVARRVGGEPLQYILGEWEFMGRPIEVERGVLIPRQETELLCELAVERIRRRRCVRAIDMCCGSGCIAISLAAFSGIMVTAADISAQALALAQRNAERWHVADKVFTIIADVRKASLTLGSFDIVVSNPPYVKSADMPFLAREVREHEPHLALDGGDDGLFYYRHVSRWAARALTKGGTIMLEAGFGMAQSIAEILHADGFREIEIYKDYAGIDRIVEARMR